MASGRRLAWGAVAIALLALAWLPEPLPPIEGAAASASFRWDQDPLWRELEERFVAAKRDGCSVAEGRAARDDATVERSLAQIAARQPGPEASVYDDLESAFFSLAAHAAACPALLPGLAQRSTALRALIQERAHDWDRGSRAARERQYRLLYGARAALEEALLQAPEGSLSALSPGVDEPSAAPSAVIRGLRMHSGDLLVSRGGAPTSALIARGNDYPGHFSHVALLHIDEISGEALAVEAHIELGLAVASIDQYLSDKKLRILVLRPRADLPALRANPGLPHAAATASLSRARAGHVPYDFAMDFSDPAELFCSEVASSAYAPEGLTLWMELSRISSPVLRHWLAGFGVRHFHTQAPSDLEYDPSLRLVAEYRDPEVLVRDHLDSAVIDAMLELAEAEEPAPLPYDWWLLGPSRVLKLYSALRVALGGVGPIPEGMTATSALRHAAFTDRHATAVEKLSLEAQAFQRERGYRPPYWELVRLARESLQPAAVTPTP